MPKPRRRKTPPKGKFVPRFSLPFPFQFVCIFTNRRLEKGTWTVTIESPGAVRGWQVDEGKHLSIKDFEKNLNLLQIQTWRAVQNTAWFSSLDESYTIHWSRLTKLHKIGYFSPYPRRYEITCLCTTQYQLSYCPSTCTQRRNVDSYNCKQVLGFLCENIHWNKRKSLHSFSFVNLATEVQWRIKPNNFSWEMGQDVIWFKSAAPIIWSLEQWFSIPGIFEHRSGPVSKKPIYHIDYPGKTF